MFPLFLSFLPTAGFPLVSLVRIASYSQAQYLVREWDTMIDLKSLALFKYMAKHSSMVIRIKLGFC